MPLTTETPARSRHVTGHPREQISDSHGAGLGIAGGPFRQHHPRWYRRPVAAGRTAPLPSDAADAVALWLASRKQLGLTGWSPLFCTLKGEPLWDSYVRALCKRLAAKAGVERRVHPHGFRHGWALAQVESGTSLPVIQQLLGHSSLATTATYVSHIAPAKAVAEATAKTAHLAVQP
jgi:integrase